MSVVVRQRCSVIGRSVGILQMRSFSLAGCYWRTCMESLSAGIALYILWVLNRRLLLVKCRLPVIV